MQLITHLKNGSRITTKLHPFVTLDNKNRKMTKPMINLRLDRTSRAIGGSAYVKHIVEHDDEE